MAEYKPGFFEKIANWWVTRKLNKANVAQWPQILEGISLERVEDLVGRSNNLHKGLYNLKTNPLRKPITGAAPAVEEASLADKEAPEIKQFLDGLIRARNGLDDVSRAPDAAKVLSITPPEEAASILSTIQNKTNEANKEKGIESTIDPQVVSIVKHMDSKQDAAILGAMNQEKANQYRAAKTVAVVSQEAMNVMQETTKYGGGERMVF